ncbi:hypothetical protein GCM10023197_41260 [Gordonia humi]
MHHTGCPGDRRFDLTELQALTAQLHLEVGAAQVLQLTVTIPPDQIARPVQPGAVAERIGDEPLRRQIRPRGVPASQLNAAQVQLTGHTDVHRAQPCVEDDGRGVRHRSTDGDHRLTSRDRVRGDVDGCLCRTVQVVQADSG